jgi:hypothetical protein
MAADPERKFSAMQAGLPLRQLEILGQLTSLSKRRIWSLPISSSDLSGAAANGGLFHFANRAWR